MVIFVAIVVALLAIGIYATLKSEKSEPEIPEWKKRELAIGKQNEQNKTNGVAFCNSILHNPAVAALADSVYEVIKIAISRSIDASLTNHIHYSSDDPIRFPMIRFLFSSIDVFIRCSYSDKKERGWTLADLTKEMDVLGKASLFRYSEFNIQALDTTHKQYGLALAVAKLITPKLQQLHLPNATKIDASVCAVFDRDTYDYDQKPNIYIQLEWDAWQDKYIEL